MSTRSEAKRIAKARACLRCRGWYVAREERPGSVFIELVLWILAIFTVLLMLPVALWYSISARKARLVCGGCGSPDIVPGDSPAGQQIIAALPK